MYDVLQCYPTFLFVCLPPLRKPNQTNLTRTDLRIHPRLPHGGCALTALELWAEAGNLCVSSSGVVASAIQTETLMSVQLISTDEVRVFVFSCLVPVLCVVLTTTPQIDTPKIYTPAA